jgi:hypothetical protein
MITKRICVYPSDIVVITGKGERYSRKIIQNLKKVLGKEKHQAITFKEAAKYLGVEEDLIFKIINDIPILDTRKTG